MAKYCDTKELEKTWLAWMVSRDTPYLEHIKDSGSLWTKLDGEVHKHCIASSTPLYFTTSTQSIPNELEPNIFKSSIMPQDPSVTRRLIEDKYVSNIPVDEAWDRLAAMIYDICMGVALNFNPPNEEARGDLAHEALTYTLDKIRRGKLTYTPGRAPVFNLVTTAVIRIMYSIKNREKRQLEHRNKLTGRLISGAALPSYRSLKVSQAS